MDEKAKSVPGHGAPCFTHPCHYPEHLDVLITEPGGWHSGQVLDKNKSRLDERKADGSLWPRSQHVPNVECQGTLWS